MQADAITRYLADLDALLPASRRAKRRILTEIADHLHESARDYRARGADDVKAAQAAVTAIGSPQSIALGFLRGIIASSSILFVALLAGTLALWAVNQSLFRGFMLYRSAFWMDWLNMIFARPFDDALAWTTLAGDVLIGLAILSVIAAHLGLIGDRRLVQTFTSLSAMTAALLVFFVPANCFVLAVLLSNLVAGGQLTPALAVQLCLNFGLRMAIGVVLFFGLLRLRALYAFRESCMEQGAAVI